MKVVVKTTLKFRRYIVMFDIQSDSLDTYILHDLLIDNQLVCEISMVHIKKKSLKPSISIHTLVHLIGTEIHESS